jgi:hypothetical protein
MNPLELGLFINSLVLCSNILYGVHCDAKHMNDDVGYGPENRQSNTVSSVSEKIASGFKRTHQGSTARLDRTKPAVSRSGSKSRQVADGAPTTSHTERSTLIPALSTSTTSVSVRLALLLAPVRVLGVCRSFSELVRGGNLVLAFERAATSAAAWSGDSPSFMYMFRSASPTCVMDGCRMAT